MDLDKVKLFYHIVRHGKLTEAAKALNLTQPGLTRHIKDLEEDLQTKLLFRDQTGVRPTEAGKILFEFATEMTEKADQVENMMRDFNQEPRGVLKIEVNSVLIQSLLPLYVADFMDKFPLLDLNLVSSEGPADLRFRKVDALIAPFQKERDDLTQDYLMSYELGLFAHQAYLEAKGTPASIQDLKEHRIAAFSAEFLEPFEKLYEDGQSLKSSIFVNSLQALTEMGKRGAGLILTDIHEAEKEKDLIRVLSKDVSLDIQFYYIYPKLMEQSQRLLCFRDFLKSAIVQKTVH
ncbi:MAG: LysR family transcriptional regulator [Alphaproteobacteria bacterium]|jgi:DNA-binding transcriptional LysR family regulator|nr:LysR family transcriptional regulator [Alphaproteobacteria bacterium]